MSAASSSERQDAQLRSDAALVRARYERIRAAAGQADDPSRVLGVVSAASGAERYLSDTIPRIARQIGQGGRWADLIIGLNNGFTSERTIERLAAIPDAQVIRLYTDARPSEAEPSAIFERPDLQPPRATIGGYGQPQHRIFVVYQRASPYAAGKIRMLGDIFLGLVIPSIEQGWRPPRYTVAFDAETIFYSDRRDRSLAREMAKVALLRKKLPGDLERVIQVLIDLHAAARSQPSAPPAPPLERIDPHDPGLALLIDDLERDPGLAITSAITRFCVYRAAGAADGLLQPDFSAPCSAMHMIYNYTCGLLPGCMCMAGGGTVGRTDCMASLLGVIAAQYPGTTSEDSLLTVLAAAVGFRTRMADHVFLTNRCPDLHDMTSHDPPRPAWQQQFVRWYAGFNAVEELYGRHNATDILGPSSEAFVTASLAIFYKHLQQTDDIPGGLALLRRFLESGSEYEAIRHLALLNPDHLTGSASRPAW